MDIKMKIILISLIILSSFFSYRKVCKEHFRIKKLIASRNLRKNKGIYNVKLYIDEKKYYKDQDWLSQRNKGVHPCDLKKPINVRRYSNECNHIIMKKGL